MENASRMQVGKQRSLGGGGTAGQIRTGRGPDATTGIAMGLAGQGWSAGAPSSRGKLKKIIFPLQ